MSSFGSTVLAAIKAVSAAPLVALEIEITWIFGLNRDFNFGSSWCCLRVTKIKSFGVRLKEERESMAQLIMGLPKTLIKGLGFLNSGFRWAATEKREP